MSNLATVSLLITCFNKKQFIDSFRRQIEVVYKLNLEIILVDDFSSDGSRESLIELKARFPEVKLILNESNLGSAASRNIAISEASRKWIFFWDIDDQVDFRVLDKMIEQANTNNVDLCVGLYESIPATAETKPFAETHQKGIHSIQDVSKNLIDQMGYWRNLYSRDFLINNRIFFYPTLEQISSKTFILDDVFFMILCSTSPGKMSYYDGHEPVYFYRSTVHTEISWSRFLSQAMLFPKASVLFVENMNSYLRSESNLIYKFVLQKTRTHMAYLRFTQWNHAILSYLRLLLLIRRQVASPNIVFEFFRQMIIALRNSLSYALRNTS